MCTEGLGNSVDLFQVDQLQFSPSNANSKGPIKQSLILLNDLVSCLFGGIYKHRFCLKTGYVSSSWYQKMHVQICLAKAQLSPFLNIFVGYLKM